MHLAGDLCAQAVNNLIQDQREVGVHAYEELVLIFVHPGRTGLDVCQVDAFLLHGQSKYVVVRSPL